MKLNIRLVISLIAFGIVACNSSVKPSEVPGIYKANFSTDGMYIYIFKNGTCKFLDSLNQKYDIKTGTWKFKNRTIDVQMGDTGGIWPAEIKNIDGVIRIVYADEEGDYFDKIKSF